MASTLFRQYCTLRESPHHPFDEAGSHSMLNVGLNEPGMRIAVILKQRRRDRILIDL
jgi:hypothetical protein